MLVPEAIAALEVRESALNLLFTLQDELASKQAQLEALSKVTVVAAMPCLNAAILSGVDLGLAGAASAICYSTLLCIWLSPGRAPLTSAQPSCRGQWQRLRSRSGPAKVTMTGSSHAIRYMQWHPSACSFACPQIVMFHTTHMAAFAGNGHRWSSPGWDSSARPTSVRCCQGLHAPRQP